MVSKKEKCIDSISAEQNINIHCCGILEARPCPKSHSLFRRLGWQLFFMCHHRLIRLTANLLFAPCSYRLVLPSCLSLEQPVWYFMQMDKIDNLNRNLIILIFKKILFYKVATRP